MLAALPASCAVAIVPQPTGARRGASGLTGSGVGGQGEPRQPPQGRHAACLERDQHDEPPGLDVLEPRPRTEEGQHAGSDDVEADAGDRQRDRAPSPATHESAGRGIHPEPPGAAMARSPRSEGCSSRYSGPTLCRCLPGGGRGTCLSLSPSGLRPDGTRYVVAVRLGVRRPLTVACFVVRFARVDRWGSGGESSCRNLVPQNPGFGPFSGSDCRWSLVEFGHGSHHRTVPVGDLDAPAEVLVFAREQRAAADRAEALLLQAAVVWAAQHPAESLEAAEVLRTSGYAGGFGDTAVPVAGPGRRWWRSSAWRSSRPRSGCPPRPASATSGTRWSCATGYRGCGSG